MKNFYIHTGGGLGDMIKHYFWGNHGWRYLKPIKEKYPNTKIKLITTCCNPIGHSLFENIPYLDEIEPHPWVDPNRPWEQLNKYIKDYNNLAKTKDLEITESIPTEVYLNQKDKETLAEYTPDNKYIIMHPFAGDSIRMNLPVQEYFPLAKLLINEFGYTVIVIGGQSQRVIGKISRTINEQFPYESDGLINLINKVNLRVACALTLSASHFIGTNSAFYCVRLATKKPASISMPNKILLSEKVPLRIQVNNKPYIITKQGKHFHINKGPK